MSYTEYTINVRRLNCATLRADSPDLPDAGYPDLATYAETREKESADVVRINPAAMYTVGQSCTYIGDGSNYNYYTMRSVFRFLKPAAVKAGAKIEYAELKFFKISWYQCMAQTIYVMNGQPDYPSVPPEASDFNMNNYSGDGGSIILEGGGANYGWKTIELNSTGLGSVSYTHLTLPTTPYV